jgi:phosphopantothenoylcysteine decarboxylase/phosphopantothenate--cysteine ligase
MTNKTDKIKVILGIGSSISIYKACEIIRSLQKRDFAAQVILTPNAGKLISPRLFNALTGFEVYCDIFAKESVERIAHIDLAREADLFLVAPATANVIGKFASGVADDFVTTFYLAATCPVVVAPAMNENMFLHPQMQDNLRRLQRRGVLFVHPGQGQLACGDEGWGRLAPTEDIVQACLDSLARSRSLAGTRVLVTAGPTREALDPVRFLSNRSSGKMGYALAQEAAARGADVILVSGPVSLPPPRGVQVRDVETAEEMASAVKELARESRIVIMAAAVADYRPEKALDQKLKKQGEDLPLRLTRTADILAELGRNKKESILVGFAAETENMESNARKKMQSKNLDMIVANDVSQPGMGFGSEENRALLMFPDGRTVQTEKTRKREICRVIFNEIEALLGREKNTDFHS